MGRHSKPSVSATSGKIAAVVTSGAFLAIPLTQGTALADDTGNSNGQSWDSVKGAIAHCESGNNPRAHNPSSTASGTFELIRGTWASVGGLLFAPSAAQASPEEQDMVAGRLFARDGLSPWDASRSCWSRLLRSGQRFVPQRSRRAQPQQSAPQRAAPRHRAYRVVSGDTLSEIAAREGLTWQQLWAQNRAEIKNPSLINIGLNLNL